MEDGRITLECDGVLGGGDNIALFRRAREDYSGVHWKIGRLQCTEVW
jgi:hypothetical protein